MHFAGFIAIASVALIGALTPGILAPAHAEKRVALVVGNDRYANLPANEQLQKAVNDARAVGRALRSIGFDVISGENLGRGALLGKFDELIRRVAPGDTAFFFFSGHGVALDGMNYILPADVPNVAAGQETRLKGEALGEQYIISELVEHNVRVAVVVLDACRTNPFARGGKGVGIAKGLVPPPQVQGVFSLYAAGSGQEALDRLYDGDPDPNSVFTRVLAPALTKPGIDLRDLAYEVREEVARIANTAGHVQWPQDRDGTIGGRVYLAGLPPANANAAGPGLPHSGGLPPDEIAWSILRDTGTAEQLRRFVRQFPASRHRGDAEARLQALEHADAALTPAVPQTGTAAPTAPLDAPCSWLTTTFFPSRCGEPAKPEAEQETALATSPSVTDTPVEAGSWQAQNGKLLWVPDPAGGPVTRPGAGQQTAATPSSVTLEPPPVSGSWQSQNGKLLWMPDPAGGPVKRPGVGQETAAAPSSATSEPPVSGSWQSQNGQLLWLPAASAKKPVEQRKRQPPVR